MRVAVCAQDRALRDRICALLAAGGHYVFAREASVDGLLGTANGEAGDTACVVIGADRPSASALGAVASARARLEPGAAVLVCRRARRTEVRRALEQGVDGVVLVDDAEPALAAVVAVVCAGQVSVPRRRRAEVSGQALTTREKQILALVITGLTNSQIAAKLFLAESTVKSHLSSAFGKLGVSSRYEAAAVILDPERGRGLGIREIRSERPIWPAGAPNDENGSHLRYPKPVRPGARKVPHPQ